MRKRISSAAVVALKQALTEVYWYKGDLRSFLSTTLSNPSILGGINWSDYKRNIVGRVVDYLVSYQDDLQSDLLRLMHEVANMKDFSHLEQLEDGRAKVQKAKASVQALQTFTAVNAKIDENDKAAENRRQQAYQKCLKITAVKQKLCDINTEYISMISMSDAQKRGYMLEKILKDVFELFDLDPKASFKIVGEQIDGAFTFDSTDYLLEAKWQNPLITTADLDILAGKLSTKLDNTLGLFLAINGFSKDGILAHSTGRRIMILMDGSHLMAVLEGRIDLIQLLLRMRRYASQTGEIYLPLHEVMNIS